MIKAFYRRTNTSEKEKCACLGEMFTAEKIHEGESSIPYSHDGDTTNLITDRSYTVTLIINTPCS